ncbi:MAG: ImmA/IrrE family metallo-endopeptidase, partial [Bacillota bacterium]|nr:ImmA/IrrE family metallo-endopeptidase [Bacillota bacterium]
NTRDPFAIAKAMNIEVLYFDLGKLKGFYKKDGHNRFIVINENLDDSLKRIVCAHELGHDQLHRHFTDNSCIKEFMLYDMKSKPEYEANLFAAELLLDDDDVIDLFHQGYSFFQTASTLNTDVNILAIKLLAMNSHGYDLKIPVDLCSNFLGKL